MMSKNVLFVDDEGYVLSSIERLFAENGMEILKAGNALDALKNVPQDASTAKEKTP